MPNPSELQRELDEAEETKRITQDLITCGIVRSPKAYAPGQFIQLDKKTVESKPNDTEEKETKDDDTDDTWNTATKLDEGKVRFDLIPPELLFAVADILTFGANKYASRNWEKGMDWGRVFGALMRHMWCWWGGKGPTTKSFLFEELDDETGKSHLWHAACCITFLITFEERGCGTDDRTKQDSP